MIKWQITKNNPNQHIYFRDIMDILCHKNDLLKEGDQSVLLVEELFEQIDNEKTYEWINGSFVSPFRILFTNKLVSVQPMTAPVGALYWMKFNYTHEESLSAQNNI